MKMHKIGLPGDRMLIVLSVIRGIYPNLEYITYPIRKTRYSFHGHNSLFIVPRHFVSWLFADLVYHLYKG